MTEPVDPLELQCASTEETVTGRGFVVPLPAALAVTSGFPFVGRDREWSELTELWRASAAGTRKVALIGGEAGAGKTRLTFEFARRRAEEQAAVVLGVCDAELTLPYQPWVQILDQLIRALPAEVTLGLTDELAELAVLLPHLEQLSPGLHRPQAADPQTERYRLFQAIATLVSAAARRQSMLVIVDDLHWADAQTLALLRHLARDNAPCSLMVIGTFRDTGDEITEPLATFLSDLRRVDATKRVRVAGLDRASVVRFVKDTIGHELDDALTAVAYMVAERSGGNPFYVSELWRHVVANDIVSCVDGRWLVRPDADAVGVPDSVRDVVSGRLAKLRAEPRHLLTMSAVAGLSVDFQVLAAATGISKDQLGSMLDDLVEAKFLVEIAGQASSSYEFAHAIVRETVERTVPSNERARLQRDLARAIEEVYASDTRPVLADLARHYVAAARLGCEDKALTYSRQAAVQAAQSGGFDAAVAHLLTARQFARPGSAETIDIALQLGDAHSRAGNIGESADDYAAAFASAREAGDVRGAAKAALGYTESRAIWGVNDERSITITRTALELIDDGDDDRRLRIRLQASLARALSLVGRHDEAVETVDGALVAARSVGDDELVLFVLLCSLHALYPFPDANLRRAEEAARLALRVNDMWSYCFARHNSMCPNLVFGRLVESSSAARDLSRVATRERFAFYDYLVKAHNVLLSLAAGRIDDAEQLADQALELGDAIGIDAAAGVHGVHMFVIRREQGRLHEVASVLRAAVRLDRTGTVWRPGLAVLLVELGMLDEARAEFAALAPGGFEAVARDSMWPCCLTFLAEVCIALADLQHAEALYHELEPFRGRTLMAAYTINFGPAERLMGSLAALLGRHDDAERHFRSALELAEDSDSPLWQAQTLYEWAAALGDRADLMATAHSIAVEFGMHRIAQRALPHIPDSQASAQVLPDNLSAREVEVLALVATGRSNRAIGDLLFISPNTVANHVRSILQKTGCANRVDAAAYATRKGLAG